MNRYKNKTDFYSVFNAISDINAIKPKSLTPSQMSILYVILSNVNFESGEAFPTQSNIRKRAGIASDTTYYKAFNQLLEKGWIIQRKRFSKSSCYKIVIPDDVWELLVSTESVDSVSTESVDLTTNINYKYITTNMNYEYSNNANARKDKRLVSTSGNEQQSVVSTENEETDLKHQTINNLIEEVDEYGYTQSDYEAILCIKN